MAALLYPLINGVRYDWSSAEIVLQGTRFAVKSLNYKHSLEPGKVRGNSAQLQGRTRGEYDAEGSIELYRSEWDTLTSLLTSQGQGYLEQEFQIIAQYAELIPPQVITDSIVGVRLKSPEYGGSEGGDALVVKCDFHAMYILENGKSPLSTLMR